LLETASVQAKLGFRRYCRCAVLSDDGGVIKYWIIGKLRLGYGRTLWQEVKAARYQICGLAGDYSINAPVH